MDNLFTDICQGYKKMHKVLGAVYSSAIFTVFREFFSKKSIKDADISIFGVFMEKRYSYFFIFYRFWVVKIFRWKKDPEFYKW